MTGARDRDTPELPFPRHVWRSVIKRSGLRLSDLQGVDQELEELVDTLTVQVRNETGSTISQNAAVHISGANSDGDTLVVLAEADVSGSMPALGVALADIETDEFGRVVLMGVIEDVALPSSTFAVGDELYVSTTAGALTKTAPTGSDTAQRMGFVTKTGTDDGQAFIVSPSIEGGGSVSGNLTGLGLTASAGQKIIGRAESSAGALQEIGVDSTLAFDTSATTLGVADAGVGSTQLGTAAVSTAKLADSAVTTVKINDGAVTTAKLGSLSVTGDIINDNSVTTNKITNLNVTTIKIALGAVGTAQLADDAVTTDKVADAAVCTDQICDSGVTSAKVATSAIIEDRIADNAVVSAKIKDGAVINSKIGDAAVCTEELCDNAITTVKITDGAVTSAKLADGAVSGGKIASGTVGTSNMASSAITANELGTDAVTTAKIAAGAVTTTEIGADAVTNAKIADDAIGTEHIADDAVTHAQMADNAVQTAVIRDGAVTTAKINDGAVTTAKLATGAVNAGALGNGAVETSAISDGAVTSAKLADTVILRADRQVGNPYANLSTTTLTQYYSLTIPGGTLATRTVRVHAHGTMKNNSGSSQNFRHVVRLGGVDMHEAAGSIADDADQIIWIMRLDLSYRAAGAQFLSGEWRVSSASTASDGISNIFGMHRDGTWGNNAVAQTDSGDLALTFHQRWDTSTSNSEYKVYAINVEYV